ncbi:Rv3235 family protein [Streptomyces sp. Qhu-G9]|nr:Rv3235 family protein [Streptomyces aurantiacus]WAU86156.1 Rv3235 family protein [Streptomyces aurantiacus]
MGTSRTAQGDDSSRPAPVGGGTRTVRGGGSPRTAPRDGSPRTSPGSGAGRPAPGGVVSRTASGRVPRTSPVGGPPSAVPAASPSPAAASPALTDCPPRTPPPQPRPTDLFADRLVAVLSGRRPVHCMLRHTVGRAYDELAWLAERGPLRTRGTRPVVRDIGYYVPRAGAVEAFARIGAGDQVRAMAFRLEQGADLRWRCTAVELGGARMPRPDED